jgi:putative tricarboxylic transport membrane protein
MNIRAPKDFWSGIMFLAFAAVALLAARHYSLGSRGRMGPGYFPILLGTVLGGLGLILVVRSFLTHGERLTRLHLVPVAIMTLGVCLFGVFIERLGLVISLIVVTMVTALEFTALALVLTAFSVGIFVYALRLPLPIWPAL